MLKAEGRMLKWVLTVLMVPSAARKYAMPAVPAGPWHHSR